MVRSAALLLREEGLRGTSFPKVLSHAHAPRGSIQHHFPGGRQEMLVDSVEWAGNQITDMMRQALDAGASPQALVAGFIAHFVDAFTETGGRAACPIGAVAQEGYADEPLRAAVASVMHDWRAELVRAIVATGEEEARAVRLADLSLAAIEGAVMIARVDQSTDALEHVSSVLGEMLPA